MNLSEFVKSIFDELKDETKNDNLSKKLEDITLTDVIRHRANALIKSFNTTENKIETLNSLIEIIKSTSCERVILYKEYVSEDVHFYFIDKFLFIGFPMTDCILSENQDDMSPEDAINWLQNELNKLVKPKKIKTDVLPFHNREVQLETLKRLINLASDYRNHIFHLETVKLYEKMATINVTISDTEVNLQIPSFVSPEFNSVWNYNHVTSHIMLTTIRIMIENYETPSFVSPEFNSVWNYNHVTFHIMLTTIRILIENYETPTHSVLPYDTIENKIKSLNEVVEILNHRDVREDSWIHVTESENLFIYESDDKITIQIPKLYSTYYKNISYSLGNTINFIKYEIDLLKELNKSSTLKPQTSNLNFSSAINQVLAVSKMIDIVKSNRKSTFYFNKKNNETMKFHIDCNIYNDHIEFRFPVSYELPFDRNEHTADETLMLLRNFRRKLYDTLLPMNTPKHKEIVFNQIIEFARENPNKKFYFPKNHHKFEISFDNKDTYTFYIYDLIGELLSSDVNEISKFLKSYTGMDNTKSNTCGDIFHIEYTLQDLSKVNSNGRCYSTKSYSNISDSHTPSDIYSELHNKLKANKYLTVLSSDTTEQFTTAEVVIDDEKYSVLYVKPVLYEKIKSTYRNKVIKLMNADLLLIHCSLTEFIEFIKYDTELYTLVKHEYLSDDITKSDDITNTIKYFNDKVKSKNVTLNVIGELVGFLASYSGFTIRLMQWKDKSPEDFISIVTKSKIIDLNIISNTNLLHHEVKSTFNLFSFLRLYFGI
jgi:hypothetical protein